MWAGAGSRGIKASVRLMAISRPAVELPDSAVVGARGGEGGRGGWEQYEKEGMRG